VDLGSVATLAFMVVVIALVPVYIMPLFNKVTRLNDPELPRRFCAWRTPTGFHQRRLPDRRQQADTRMSAM